MNKEQSKVHILAWIELLWQDVAITNPHGDCDDCANFSCWVEPHGESMCECKVLDSTLCPFVVQAVSDLGAVQQEKAMEVYLLHSKQRRGVPT